MFTDLIVGDLGKRIKAERRKWGMSTVKLAEYSATEKETIEEIENEIYYDLNFELLVNICDALQISVFSFLKKGVTVEELLNVI